MKKSLLLLLLCYLAASCENKKVNSESNNENLDASFVVGVGKIIPENDIIQLSSAVNGIVTIIYKNENDTVEIGTLILEMEHALDDQKIVQLQQQRITNSTQILSDRASIDENQAKAINAQTTLLRLKNLLIEGAETQQNVDDADTNLKEIQATTARLEANEIVSKSKLDETKAALHSAQIERDQKLIRSPIKGKILELSVLIGSAINTQEPFAQISPQGKTIAVCEIDEANASKIKIEQTGWIRNIGSSDTISTGRVYFVNTFLKKKSLFTDQSGEKEDRRVRTIKMQLDHPENLLLNARIECVIDISNNTNK